jgi:uncharacterized protein (DUF697 family)
MSVSHKPSSSIQSAPEAFERRIAAAVQATATQRATKTAQAVAEPATATAAANAVGVNVAQRWLEQGTETIGRVIVPIVDHPLIRLFSRVPGIGWILAALGQIDTDKAQAEVEQLRQQHPDETEAQLVNRLIVEHTLKAGGIGLLTNFIPPLALALLAIDVAAVAVLQSEMIYRIAAVYGFPLREGSRRAEVLAIFALARGGSIALKAGTSIVELVPGIGAVVGASTDAALLYALGYVASRFYEAKKNAANSEA